MAIVPDLANPHGVVDPTLAGINRTVSSGPIGSLTPLFVGERVRNSTDNSRYIAVGLTSADWQLATVTDAALAL